MYLDFTLLFYLHRSGFGMRASKNNPESLSVLSSVCQMHLEATAMGWTNPADWARNKVRNNCAHLSYY